ncbi:MAG: aldo/keto reductase [Lentisphaeria bacterium]|nr:aldo/keto reductase [Lentisphaeria bacterium]NQZ66889.1 aldo/keto reductase [Lentisphaeria bacterium]
MLYRTLGKAGLKVSAISIGSWRTFGQTVDDATTDACMSAAYDAGINFFDGAEAYGNGAAELAMGKVFKAKNWDRDTLVISSKVVRVGEKATQSGLSRKHLVEACDAALKRMHLDYVDLFFCHRPDPDTGLEEIVHTMNELIQRGKIFYWGTSEFSAEDLSEMYAIAARDGLVGPTMEQTNHSMLNRKRVEGELLPIYEEHGLGTTIYSPLAIGMLTGKYNDGVPERSAIGEGGEWMQSILSDENLAKTRQLSALAEELDMKTSQLALAWCLKNPNVSTCIIGATKAEQVTENAAAADKVEALTDEVMEKIKGILD